MLWLLAACAPEPPEPGERLRPVAIAEGIQIGEEGDGIPCDEIEHPTDDPEADAFVASLPTELAGILELVGGGEFALDVLATPVGEVRSVERVPRVAGAVGCDGEWYRVDLDVAIAAPPALDEHLPMWAESRGDDGRVWRGAVPLADVHGTLRPTDLDPADWDELYLDLPARADGNRWLGDAIWRGRTEIAWGEEAAATWSAR